MRRFGLELALLAVALTAFAGMLLGNLGHPLLWSDEADTAMFGTRVIEHGYPKVHGPRNVVYQFGPNVALGIDERTDAYIGTTWGHFYFAVPGLLWAARTDDPWRKTARARLPFALAGAAGVGLWIAALAPALGPDPRRRLRFAALFVALAALSVSLLLHLREVRYYALLVLIGGALARVTLRRSVYGTLGGLRYALELAALLVLLFHTFYAAFFAAAPLLALERALAAWRGRGRWRDLAPFALAAALVAPALVFFETFAIAGEFARDLGLGPRAWAANAGAVVLHLLRHEMLAPALLARAAVAAARVGPVAARRAATGLLAFAAGYVAIGAGNPLALERYFVALSPLLLGAFLLDAFSLVEGLPARWPALPRRRAAAAVAAALACATAGLRAPGFAEVAGRLRELRVPVRGPLDFAVEWIRERYPDPESLVIATNYEEQALMYYLGAHVIVGSNLNNLRADRALEPDLVIPRRRWPRSLRELGPLLARGEWEAVRLPVHDTHWNNVPALSRSRFVPDPHRFETPATDDPDAQLVIYRRVASSKRTGTSSSP
jgi:hypothetical protein